jgi:hypothetical protein
MTSKKKPKSRSKKAPRKAAPKSSSPTLANVADGYLADLEKHGKSASTITSYRIDLGVALRHFGPETKAAGITQKQVETFNTSAAVTKTRAGKAKAKPGVLKTRRVLRLALVWAADAGLIEKAPIPATKS